MNGWLGLRGRSVVITGAGGGVGQGLAAGFAAAGARLALLDRDTQRCEAAAAASRIAGTEAIGVPCDVSEPESVEQAARQVLASFGQCDVLVNNAAVLRAGALDKLSLADWNAMIAVNLTGYFLCAQSFGRDMLARGGGSVIHIASIAASHPQGASGAYSVTKAGVAMLSRQLATEWGPRGVRSNVVSPGLIRTPMSEPFYADPSVLARRTAVVPVRRIGAPSDVTDAAMFLASERASYVNGDEIVVDGGFTNMIMNLIPRPGHD